MDIKEHGYSYALYHLQEYGLSEGLYDAILNGIFLRGNFMKYDSKTLDPIEDKKDYFAK
jgi:hypothetical protein